MQVSKLGQVIESEGVSASASCLLAQTSYTDARREQARWQMLVFVMGCAFGVSLLAAIVLFAVDSGTRSAGLVALVGTVASGAATAWMVKQRNDASLEKAKAHKLVADHCEEPKETIAELDEGADPATLVRPIRERTEPRVGAGDEV